VDAVVYWIFRSFEAALARLPLSFVFRLGSALGSLMRWVLPGYRRLVRSNLASALPELSLAERHRIERDHFRLLGGNLLAAVKTPFLPQQALMERVEIEGLEKARKVLARKQGIVLAIPHTGNWEMYAQLAFLLPGVKTGAVYQSLRNRKLDHHLNTTRRRFGMATFNRSRGFHEAVEFLREGGIVGILADQHTGDAGVWTPFFNRLASTSPLAATLGWRSGAKIFVATCLTDARQIRWRFEAQGEITPTADIEATTLEINRAIERGVRRQPADWFWVHNRWKTPRPNFLLDRYRRGVHLPEEAEANLQRFRVMVRSPNWLGDAVMAMPAVEAIAKGRPDLELTVVTPSNLAPLWRRMPGVDRVIPLPARRKLFSSARTIREAGPFDTAILFPNSLRSALEARLAGVGYCAGYGNSSSLWLLKTSPPPLPPMHPPEHHGRRYLRLARWLGAEITEHGPLIAPRIAAKPETQRRDFEGAVTLACCPGAEFGPAKRWPAERFAEVAAKVAQRRHCHWLLLGVAKDQPITEEIADALGNSATDLAGKTTLDELIGTLAGCRLLLTNDTGTMHLAAALGVPLVAIFGSTEPILTGPLSDRAILLRHHVECSPCFQRECPIDFRCMEGVTVDSAVEAVLRLLEQPGLG